jgi:hypothetical protein
MTPTQQRKIAELLVSKLKQAQNKPFVEITSHEEIQAEIQAKMGLAGVVYELMERAYMQGYFSDFYDFDNFLNNITWTTHEMK